MPDIKTDDGCIIHVEVEGPERAPVLMLSNSLGTNLHMWDDQVAPLTRHFRLVRYDRRGHGKSSVPKGPYSMERLGRDVVAVLDALEIAKINWCGLSMGGMVGQWLGANAGKPHRQAHPLQHLVLLSRQDHVGRPHQAGAREGTGRHRRRQYGALVHQGIPRTLAAGDGKNARNVRGDQCRGLYRLRRSDPRHGSSSAVGENHRADTGHRRPVTIRRRRSKATNSSASTFPAPESPCSTPPISPIWSSRRFTPTRCLDFC